MHNFKIGTKVRYCFGYYTYGETIDEYGDREIIDEWTEKEGIILELSGRKALCLFIETNNDKTTETKSWCSLEYLENIN